MSTVKTSTTAENWIASILTNVVVFFLGGFFFMQLMEGIMDLWSKPGLGYWTSCWFVILSRWTLELVLQRATRLKLTA